MNKMKELEQIIRLLEDIRDLIKKGSSVSLVSDAKLPLLGESIESLGLTSRALNCLESDGIITIGQLLDRTPGSLCRDIRGFGKTTLREVKRKLEYKELYLLGERPPAEQELAEVCQNLGLDPKAES
jgi:DNA-directed RNA polymerase subunit alpha